MKNGEVKVVTGADVLPWLNDLARLRITVFREYPYLYEGELEYEQKYLATYAASARSLFVLALRDGEVLGVSTGTAMMDETAEVKRPFVEQGMEVEKIFYFGESVLKKEERGQGIGVSFMNEREAFARRAGFHWAVFCAVERPDGDRRRPEGYVPLDEFWRKRGFERSDLRTEFSWREVGEEVESPKTMVFWIKSLR